MRGALIETEARKILNQGINETKKKIASKMLKMGKLTIEEIADCVELSVTEVERLAEIQGAYKICTGNEFDNILLRMNEVYHSVFGSRIVKILLYGSYARGDIEENSDIDLVAIVHGKRTDLQRELKKVWDISTDLELEYGIIISPTVIPFEEFEKYKNDLPYYRNILKEGVAIHV